jgi:fumarate reductase flavoprotein subunit
VAAYRTQKMLKVALCVAYGALVRTESRGAHYRAGPPAPRRRRLAQAHAGHLEARGDTLPTLAYEPLDVMTMELPPGLARLRRQGLHRPPRHRRAPGRGGRAAEALAGADRTRCRQALLPYEHLLPPRCAGATSASTSRSRRSNDPAPARRAE